MRGRKPAYNLRIISYPDTSEPPTVHLCRGESAAPLLTGEHLERDELDALLRWAKSHRVRVIRDGQLFEGTATPQERPADIFRK